MTSWHRFDPDDTGLFDDKEEAAPKTQKLLKHLDDLQYRLYAEGKRSLLIILQGMDTAGKDGTIRHVMSGVSPQGCRVTSFKAPTPEELSRLTSPKFPSFCQRERVLSGPGLTNFSHITK